MTQSLTDGTHLGARHSAVRHDDAKGETSTSLALARVVMVSGSAEAPFHIPDAATANWITSLHISACRRWLDQQRPVSVKVAKTIAIIAATARHHGFSLEPQPDVGSGSMDRDLLPVEREACLTFLDHVTWLWQDVSGRQIL